MLEVACGTGTWTRLLTQYADELTALDSSPEMLRLARVKVGEAEVRFVEADVFSWRQGQTYEAVVFANRLSHAPPNRFEGFWSLVRDCLSIGGRVFFWKKRSFAGNSGTEARMGRQDLLGAERAAGGLRALNWDARVESTGDFIWGECQLSPNG